MSSKFDIVFDADDENAIFSKWKIQCGAFIRPSTVLFSYSVDETAKNFKTTNFGTVERLCEILPGQKLDKGQFIMQLRSCEHPVVMKDMCADCGQDLRRRGGFPGEREGNSRARVAMIHSIPELQITPDEAKMHGSADEENLLKQRKLVLLVDLDQTLIHTTNEDVNPNMKDIHHFQLYGSTSPWYHTRLRPNTRQFLEKISNLYELHICTFGARMYAHTVAKILDPDCKLFGHRILSREECFDPNLKTANLKALFPCGDRLVCIIDDREDVWNFAPNVVHVKPYRFFKQTGDINAPPGFAKVAKEQKEKPVDFPSTSSAANGDVSGQATPGVSLEEKSSNEPLTNFEACDDDDYLFYLEEILTRVHSAFYQVHDQLPCDERPPDLKSIVPYVKSKVLKNVTLAFSGVVPTNSPLQLSSIYKAAMAFGAEVQTDLNLPGSKHDYQKFKGKPTTHLVAAKYGTAKVYQARKVGSSLKIVTPQWLWCCAERWERVDERLFPLTKDSTSLTDRAKARSGKVQVQEEEKMGEGLPMTEECEKLFDEDAEGLAVDANAGDVLGAKRRSTGLENMDDTDEPPSKKPNMEDVAKFSSSSSSSTGSQSSSSGSESSSDDEHANAMEPDDEEIVAALERQLSND